MPRLGVSVARLEKGRSVDETLTLARIADIYFANFTSIDHDTPCILLAVKCMGAIRFLIHH